MHQNLKSVAQVQLGVLGAFYGYVAMVLKISRFSAFFSQESTLLLTQLKATTAKTWENKW